MNGDVCGILGGHECPFVIGVLPFAFPGGIIPKRVGIL